MNAMDRPAPPVPVARKDTEINKKYEDRAKAILRDAIRQKGVTIPELTERLSAIGIDMSSGGVANKISRGGFSSAFLMQCLDALGMNLAAEDKS